MLRHKRYNIKELLADPKKRKAMFIGVIMFCQAHEGREPDEHSACRAYDKIRKEKEEAP